MILIGLINLVFISAQSAVVKHYCGANLSNALSSICKQNGFPLYFPGSDQEILPKENHRGVVEECCLNPCSKSQLRQFCGKDLALQSRQKRKRSHHYFGSSKRSKSKTIVDSIGKCESQLLTAKKRKVFGRKRNPTSTLHRLRKLNFRPFTTTTESSWSPEVQYIDDWPESGETSIFFQSRHLKPHH